ncbi:HD-GYP domain-containing protein [Aquabacterium sp. A08]|uniref:HD-GYP domain-containing protein n=1 Tax=Aquabacterium sp. A08 TaxID=2718532 RepID=UPI001422E39A|nr:HD domain-containing phosphohydrolase [Aquabacterium sp. A08]NIC42981.1 hypothetical protein [Aquabacterium sp. A08]
MTAATTDTDPQAALADAARLEVRAQLDPSPAEAWPALRRRLAMLLQEGAQAKDFRKRLAFIEAGVRLTLEGQEDDSLFVLVQMLSDRSYGYCATHALTSAITCLMLAPLAKLDTADTDALLRAALTMNIAMAAMQDQLAIQIQPASEAQKQIILQHPSQGVELLRQLGVDDARWLGLVADHHEAPDGSGYPLGKSTLDTAQQLLRMADIFIARISPRVSRRGLMPNVAVGNLYLEAQAQSNSLGALFAKQMGMYPPGTYVRLKSEETAVVVRRGERVNTPVALAIADPDGLPLTTPRKRDTQQPGYSVQSPVAPEDVKIRLDKARLLKRL